MQALQDMSQQDFSNFELTNRKKKLKVWREKVRKREAMVRRHRMFNLSKQLAKHFEVSKP